MENRDNLITELDVLVEALQKYRDALDTRDREELTRLLDEGKKRKEQVDGT